MLKENKYLLAAVVFVAVGLILIYVEPTIFSAVSGVPSEFLAVQLPFGKAMNINVTSLEIGKTATVFVGENASIPISNATLKIIQDDSNLNLVTGKNGTATFLCTSNFTAIFASAEGYVPTMYLTYVPLYWTIIQAIMYCVFVVDFIPSVLWLKKWNEAKWWRTLPMLSEMQLILELGKISREKYNSSKRYWKKREKLGLVSSSAVLNKKNEQKRQAIMELLINKYGW
jgi:hypothetical protein